MQLYIKLNLTILPPPLAMIKGGGGSKKTGLIVSESKKEKLHRQKFMMFLNFDST